VAEFSPFQVRLSALLRERKPYSGHHTRIVCTWIAKFFHYSWAYRDQPGLGRGWILWTWEGLAGPAGPRTWNCVLDTSAGRDAASQAIVCL